jgi:hypothetical protein
MVAIGRVPHYQLNNNRQFSRLVETRYYGYPRDRTQARLFFFENWQDPQRQQNDARLRGVQSGSALANC